VVQTVVQAPLVQVKAPHGTVESLRQVPEPSQVWPVTELLTQVVAPHGAPFG
jgi:hypothetical protein